MGCKKAASLDYNRITSVFLDTMILKELDENSFEAL